ncbi:MAG: SCP2 sterol-binding domain-containing protein [Chloroflexi bacterium]|nr:SCP2 sterol-binding domain-containing protein [Chloroflexota bacterium]
MVANFDQDKMQGINATIQFDLDGDSGGLYWVRIADSGAESGEGKAEDPKMTLKADANDFVGMINGDVNPMQAFMSGKIKIQGDTSLALKLMPLING